MRQTIHLRIVTAAAAVVMCCSLPYATRANLDYSFKPEEATVRENGMAAAAPIQFIGFPSTLKVEVEIPSIDLCVTTLQGFIALSKELRADTRWPDVGSRVTEPTELSRPAKVPANAQGVLDTSPGIENDVDRIAFRAPVLAPAAFLRFCARYPGDCKVRPTEFDHALVPLTKARMTELSKVNRDVNHSIKPQENLRGVAAEEWLVAPRRGDCNDYAVTKRHELLAHGWPSHSLLLAEVVVAWGEHHLVLIVRTREEDLILDNLNGKIRPLSQLGYQLVRAQQTKNPKFWSTVNVARTDRVAVSFR
jgi:predicted transglutaminase-like cysteine proteinase